MARKPLREKGGEVLAMRTREKENKWGGGRLGGVLWRERMGGGKI